MKNWMISYWIVDVVGKTIKNEAKEQKVDFSMLLGTLGASLLGNPYIGKEVKAKISRQ